MKRPSFRLLAAAAWFAVCALPVLAAPQVGIRAVVQDPDRYDGKVVSVVGTITAYRERVSRAGNPYTTFRLTDGEASLSVFVWERQGLRDGQRIRVTGTFAKAKRVATYTFGNEIQAHRIDVLR